MMLRKSNDAKFVNCNIILNIKQIISVIGRLSVIRRHLVKSRVSACNMPHIARRKTVFQLVKHGLLQHTLQQPVNQRVTQLKP